MDSEIIFVVEEAPESGYTAKALGHSIYTEADNLPELRENVREAVVTHYDEGKPFLITILLNWEHYRLSSVTLQIKETSPKKN